MKKIVLLVLALQISVFAFGQVKIKPTIKSKTTFAIVVDTDSYEYAKNEIEAYKEVIEADQLGVYILVDNWTHPEQIRKELIQLHQEKTPLEGAVFVGDIPIPMLRDAQHMTSAFKMDQKKKWHNSSIPSDRYYDDFDLKFDFLKQDEKNSSYYYFSLRPDSPQKLSSDIYSARIRPLQSGDVDPKEQIKRYLSKVVKERTENAQNALDHLTMARGYGYNSESKVAWSGEQIALREHLPNLFHSNHYVKFMDYETRWPMKPIYLNEVCYPDLDVLLFHHHGSPKNQYINGYKRGSDINTSIENIKYYLRTKLKGNKDAAKRIEQFKEEFGLPEGWLTEALDEDNRFSEADSLLEASLEIRLSDLKSIKPNARFVMLDACFNGSFHVDDYVAGNYIFNEGTTMAVQANTVNALQDKWPDQMIGLLDMGVRLGNWHKQVSYLETHLIGDPTYRFYAPDVKDDINAAITLQKKNNNYWKKQLSSKKADMQSLALKMLVDNNYPGGNQLLLDTYKNSPYGVVRMEVLYLLGRTYSPELVEVLKLSSFDSYELVRRFAVYYIANTGNIDLLPSFVNSMLNDGTSERVSFKIMMNLINIDLEALSEEFEHQVSKYEFYDDSHIEKYRESIERTKKAQKKNIELVENKEEELKWRIFQVRNYRNNPATRDVERLLNVALDESQEKELRIVTLEALGWYIRSYKKNDIVKKLETARLKTSDIEISSAMLRTINRLNNFML